MTTTDDVFSKLNLLTVHKNEEYPNPPSFEKEREKKREKKKEREKIHSNSSAVFIIYLWVSWLLVPYLCILGVCDFKVRVLTQCKA